jgi:hypothetical protein
VKAVHRMMSLAWKVAGVAVIVLTTAPRLRVA